MSILYPCILTYPQSRDGKIDYAGFIDLLGVPAVYLTSLNPGVVQTRIDPGGSTGVLIEIG